MKRIILIGLLAILTYPAVVSSQPFFSNGYCEIKQCYICGRDIAEWQENYTFGSWGDSVISVPYCSYDLPLAEKLWQSRKLICPDCKKAYQEKYTDMIDSFYNKLREENEPLRIEYEKQRRLKKINEIEEEIQQLKKKLNDLTPSEATINPSSPMR